MKGGNTIIPIPVPDDLASEIEQAAEETVLSKADVMRQALRIGVPKVVEAFRDSKRRKRPACLDYLDKYPPSPVTAKDSKAYLQAKFRHGPSHR